MTLDEAILHAREVASEQKRRSGACVQNDSECDKFSTCLKCAEEHEQLAEWLEELKDCRDKNKMVVRIDVKNLGSVTNKAIELAKEQYNKAIDDFAEKAIKIVYESNNRDRNPQPRDMVADIHYKFIELAKQLKVGDGK